MSTKAPIRPFSLASVNRHFADLVQRAEMLGQLQSVIDRIMEPELAGQYRVANLANGRLTLMTTSAIWATRLRFESAKLLDQLRALPQTGSVREILVKVSPFGRDWEAEKRPIPPLSVASASLLREVAASMIDPAQKAALMRLSGRGKGGS